MAKAQPAAEPAVEEPTPQPDAEPQPESTPDAPLKPEVVEPPTSQEIERAAIADAQRAAVEHAADLAVMPGAAARDEFLSLAMQARVLSMSGAAPDAIRDNPHVALHIVMIGRDLGISPSAAVELIDVIETKKGPRPSLSPQLLNGQIRRLGLGSIVKVVSTDQRCVAVALGPGGRYDPRCKQLYPEHHVDCRCTIEQIIGESEFTWADAQMAGLVGKNCAPDDHKRNNDGRCPCNQGYRTYPARMMWWRASGFCADDYFPEAGLGLYTAEELGAVVDADGRPIDASSVELPAGYEPSALPKGSAGAPPAELTDEERAAHNVALWELQERVAALPDEGRVTLRERWAQLQRLKGHKLTELPPDLVQLVAATVRGIEGQTKAASKGAWDPERALADVRAQEAQIVASIFALAGAPLVAPETLAEPATTGDASDAGEPATGDTAGERVEVEPGLTAADLDLLRSAPPEKTKAAIELAQKVDPGDLVARLTKLSLPSDGDDDVLRRRYAISVLREAIETPDEQ
jgi:hypothetical protein